MAHQNMLQQVRHHHTEVEQHSTLVPRKAVTDPTTHMVELQAVPKTSVWHVNFKPRKTHAHRAVP